MPTPAELATRLRRKLPKPEKQPEETFTYQPWSEPPGEPTSDHAARLEGMRALSRSPLYQREQD